MIEKPEKVRYTGNAENRSPHKGGGPSSAFFYDPSAGCDVCFEKRGSGPTARTPSIFSPYSDPNLIYILSRAEQPEQQPVLRSAHGTENRIHSSSPTLWQNSTEDGSPPCSPQIPHLSSGRCGASLLQQPSSTRRSNACPGPALQTGRTRRS